MNTQRIFIDSQSNPIFMGDPAEQAFDQRAGLCQAQENDIIVTTSPIDPDYLTYWENLGYSIPHLVVAGPFEEDKNLSQLICSKPDVQGEILRYVNVPESRLEFFTVFQSEQEVAKLLDLPAYTNFELSFEYKQKVKFKELCQELDIPHLPYVQLNGQTSWDFISQTMKSSHGYMAKGCLGTGGIALGHMFALDKPQDLDQVPRSGKEMGYYIEPKIPLRREISVHWETTAGGIVHRIGYFDQLADNSSYEGVRFPLQDVDPTVMDLVDKGFKALSQGLAERGALGYMCCDVLVHEDGEIFWSDLNVRKGAVLFVVEAVRRLPMLEARDDYEVFHKKVNTGVPATFSEVKEVLDGLLEPTEKGFVLITNPGSLAHGYVDITAISFNYDSLDIFRQAKERLQKLQ